MMLPPANRLRLLPMASRYMMTKYGAAARRDDSPVQKSAGLTAEWLPIIESRQRNASAVLDSTIRGWLESEGYHDSRRSLLDAAATSACSTRPSSASARASAAR